MTQAQTAPTFLMKWNDSQLVSPPAGTLIMTGPTTGHDAWLPGTIRVFTSEWRLNYVLGQGWRGTALLDLEKWSHTPLSEQENPVYYFRKAYQAAQHYGVQLISSPAPDLWGSRHPGQYLDNIRLFTADALAIQPQIWGVGGPNPDDSTLQWVVRTAVADNTSRELVYGGLSTCAGGWPRTSAQVRQSYTDTRLYGVTNIWLNVPEAGPQKTGSPGCPDGNPVPARDLLTYVSSA